VEFVRKMIAFVRRFPVLQRRRFALGKDLDDDGVPDLTWFGSDQGDPRWSDPDARTLCVQLDSSEDGATLNVERLFVILNAEFKVQQVKLPRLESKVQWRRAIDTSLASGDDFTEIGAEVRLDPADSYIANPRSTVVLLAQ